VSIALTGVNPSDPIPGLLGEIRFAQGTGNVTLPERLVLLYGSKTTAGSETVEELNGPILDRADCIARFGARSEIRWMWEAFNLIPQQVTIYAIAITAAGGGAAATRAFTFATTATGSTNIIVEWAGRTYYVPVTTGDTAIVQAAAVAAITDDWEEGGVPFTAAVGSNPSDHIVTFTSSQADARAAYVLNGIRIRYETFVGSTVSAAASANAAGVDDFTGAYALADGRGLFYYQVNPKFSTSAPTSTDNGVGEGIAYITAAALPTNGKRQQMHFGLVGTNAQAITVTTDSDANNVRAKFWWAENSPMFPGMVAALHCAIVRQAEVAHAGANVNGYSADAAVGRVYPFPAPYASSDYPTTTEIRNALNNGICPIGFDAKGAPYIVRHITSRSLNGTANDYRAREGHIPSAMDYALDLIMARYGAQKQQLPLFSATDLARGQRPRDQMMYPTIARGIVTKGISDLTGSDGSTPVLDPATEADQINSVVVESLTDGYAMRANLLAVRHNNKGQFLILESGPAY
jgi:phage tail sheath gpL-like